MRNALFAPALGLALLALSACGGAQNEAATANEIQGGDSNAMGEAVSDVDAANAAMENAFTAAENAYAAAAPADTAADGNVIVD